MTITTVNIACDVGLPNNTEFSAARLDFTLSGPDYDTASNDAIPAATVSVTLDASGTATAALWPVDLGMRNTHYAVVLNVSFTANGRVVSQDFSLGNIQPQSTGGADLANLLAQSSGGLVSGSTIYDTIADAVQAAINAASRSPITPEQFDAVGDGVEDDTAEVIAAVAEALSSGRALYFAGTYLTTATIPNLHNIYKFGPGSIKVGSTLFPIEPQRTASDPRMVAPDESDVTNTLFVATTGNNDNDGLGAGRELLTLGGAFNVMANYGPTLSGLWKVSMAAGTYAANASAGHKFMSHSPIFIEGQTSAGDWTEPTTIIDGVDYTLNGIGFNYYQAAYLKDIKTTRCANGVIAVRFCSVWFDNVWSEDDVVGRSVLTQSYHASKGGAVIDAQSIGVQELFNSVSSYNEDAAHYLLIDGGGVTETGWQRKECCSGHLDYVEIMDCTQVELELQSTATANVGGMKLGGGSAASPVGIFVANSEIHDYNQVIFNAVNPATTPIRLAGNAAVPDQYGWTGDASALLVGIPAPALINGNFSDQTITAGAGSDQTVADVTLRQGFFRMRGYTVRIEATALVVDDGAAGVTAGTLQFRPAFAGSTMFAVTLPAGYMNKVVRFEMEVTITAAGSQRYWARLSADGVAPIVVEGSAANGDTGTTQVLLRMRRSVATDVFTMKTVKVFG